MFYESNFIYNNVKNIGFVYFINTSFLYLLLLYNKYKGEYFDKDFLYY